jgi:dihydroorotase
MNAIKTLPVFLLVLLTSLCIQAQDIDILLKGGHVIDPKNKIDSKMDVAISGGKISQVAANIPATGAKKVIDVTGLYVTPGLINMHTHVFSGSNTGFTFGSSSQLADAFAPRAGITTVVDAGTSGWKTFPEFKSAIIDKSVTRILAFLNIAGPGYTLDDGQENISDMDAKTTADMIKKYPDVLVGVRVGRFKGSDWAPFDRAAEAGRMANVPLIVECMLPGYTLERQLERMRSGDILTHAFENVPDRTPFIDEKGKVKPFVFQAQKKGILFDVGHGGAGFWYNQAIPAFKQGILPNSFGTDEHRSSMNSGMKTMLNVMSKYLLIGMTMQDVIARATWLPAQSIKHEELGNLSEGSVADIAVLSLQKGKFGFVDSGNNKLEGDRKLEAELTVRAGKIIWDLNGLAVTELSK